MKLRIAAVLALAVVIVAAAFVEIRRRDPRIQLDAAVGDLTHRPFETRLAGAAWVRRPRITRAAAVSLPLDQAKLRNVAASVATATSDSHLRAVATLMSGDTAAAREAFRSLAATSASAETWNNLAVALSAEARGDVALLSSALTACAHALELQPNMAEAYFNRAVILEDLGLRSLAERAFRDYLLIDGTSPWATEARERASALQSKPVLADEWQRLVLRLEAAAAAGDERFVRDAVVRFPQEARTNAEAEFMGEWASADAGNMLALSRRIAIALEQISGESLLRDSIAAVDDAAAHDRARMTALRAAHAAYREGRRLYGNREVARALDELRRAQRLFVEGRSPMALLAQYYAANAEVDRGRRKEALIDLQEISARTSVRYRALNAQTRWLRGTIAGMDGLLEQTLELYRASYDDFMALRERQNAIELRTRMASLLTLLGRTSEAWQLHRQSFISAGAIGEPWRVQRSVYAVATQAAHDEQWEIAYALLDIAAGIEQGNPRVRADALVWRPLAAQKAGLSRAASAALEAAKAAPANVADPELRNDVVNELRLVEAFLIGDEEPDRAIALLTDYIDGAQKRGHEFSIPEALVARARVERAANRLDVAEADLRRSIDWLEQRRAAMSREDLRDSFLGKSAAAYNTLSDLLETRGDLIAAISAADRRRARMILDRIEETVPREPLPWNRLPSLLPPNTTMLAHGVFEDRIVVFSIGNQGIQRSASRMRPRELERLISQHRDAIAKRDLDAVRTSGRSLYDVLVGAMVPSTTDTLVFVRDGATERIPFATLVDPKGRFLIETNAVLVAPSIDWYVRIAQRSTTEAPASVVAIGNPTLDRIRFPDLEDLRGAEAEAHRVGASYASATVLTGEDARLPQILATLPHCDVFHAGAHALIDPSDPQSSRILLAGEGALTANVIAGMHLEHLRAAVLAGCRTAVSAEGYGDTRNLAAGFLAAGTRNVLATLWDIDDDVVPHLIRAFHERLRSGMSAAESLRAAQLQMLRSRDARLTDPRVWGSLQLYGAGS